MEDAFPSCGGTRRGESPNGVGGRNGIGPFRHVFTNTVTTNNGGAIYGSENHRVY